jgi:hypothetical protein
MDYLKNHILHHIRDREFRNSTILAALFLGIALVCNFYAGSYATRQASNAVTDIILDNIPVFNVSFVFIYGTLLWWTCLILVLIAKPTRIPFTLKSISLFILVRSVFVMLTHIAPAQGHLILPLNNPLDDFTFGGDLFFSGHTGLPFLMALLFWELKFYRYAFLASSVIFAVVVLLGHIHYSIDVLGAYFITYTIFHMCEKFFAKDEVLFKKGISTGQS